MDSCVGSENKQSEVVSLWSRVGVGLVLVFRVRIWILSWAQSVEPCIVYKQRSTNLVAVSLEEKEGQRKEYRCKRILNVHARSCDALHQW